MIAIRSSSPRCPAWLRSMVEQFTLKTAFAGNKPSDRARGELYQMEQVIARLIGADCRPDV